jgi:hypothetical protein
MRPSIKYVLVGVICAVTAWMGSGFVASASPNDQPVTASAAKKKSPEAKGYSCANGLTLKTMKGMDGSVTGSVKYFSLHNDLVSTDYSAKTSTLRASLKFRNPAAPHVKICKLVVLVMSASNGTLIKTITAKPGRLYQDYVLRRDGPSVASQVDVYWIHAS